MRALIPLPLLLLAAAAPPPSSQAGADPCAPTQVGAFDFSYTVRNVPGMPVGEKGRVGVQIPIVQPPDPACTEEPLPHDILRGPPAPGGLLRGDSNIDPLTGRPRGSVTIRP